MKKFFRELRAKKKSIGIKWRREMSKACENALAGVNDEESGI